MAEDKAWLALPSPGERDRLSGTSAWHRSLPVLVAFYHQLVGDCLLLRGRTRRNGLTAIALIPGKAPVGAVSISAKERP
jgi:hypothetical protein